ncbi:MAG: FeoC-like transcriptional regulator [Promethearchaeota archaeon]
MSEKEEKLLIRKATLNLRRKYGRTKQIDVIERDAFIPRHVEEEIKKYISKRKSITATELAIKFDVRVSTIKLLLNKYMEEGLLKLLDPSLKLKIYVPVSQ